MSEVQLVEYRRTETVFVAVPGVKGTFPLSVEDAKRLYRQLGEVLYGGQNTPKQIA